MNDPEADQSDGKSPPPTKAVGRVGGLSEAECAGARSAVASLSLASLGQADVASVDAAVGVLKDLLGDGSSDQVAALEETAREAVGQRAPVMGGDAAGAAVAVSDRLDASC